jgi:hypothetical protein
MAFRSSQEAESRLRTNMAELTAQEVRDLMEWTHQLSIAAERRLSTELALQNIEAVQKFDESSSKLTKWIIGMTVILVVLTIVIAYYSFVLGQAEKKQSDGQSIHYTPRDD